MNAAELQGGGAIRVTIDLRVKSPNGLQGAEHFRSRHHRRRYERRMVRRAIAGMRVPEGPWLIVWTRVGPLRLDSDNLSTSFKAPRDEVGDWIGVDDSDPRVTWEYQQRVGRVAATPEERMKDKGRHFWRSWVELTIVGNAVGVPDMRCADPGQLAAASCASRGRSEPGAVGCGGGDKVRRRATRRAEKAGGHWGGGPTT